MKYSTKAMFGKINVQDTCAYDYINWAEEMLIEDYDSPSLRILAGLDPYNRFWEEEVGTYFWGSIEELNIEIPKVEDSISAYACEIVQKIIDDQLIYSKSHLASCHLVIMTLSNIYDQYLCDGLFFYNYSNYEKIWLELSNTLGNILAGDFQSFVMLENFDNGVKQRVAIFLAKMESYN